MNHKIWVVVANGSRARILEAQKSHKLLIELEALDHPQTRVHGHDLVSDRPGREFSSTGSRRSAMETLDPQKNEAQHFAAQLSKHLDHAHRCQLFEKLYLIASPAFLGLMRNDLEEKTQKAIVQSIDKDLTEKNAEEIREYLPDLL